MSRYGPEWLGVWGRDPLTPRGAAASQAGQGLVGGGLQHPANLAPCPLEEGSRGIYVHLVSNDMGNSGKFLKHVSFSCMCVNGE